MASFLVYVKAALHCVFLARWTITVAWSCEYILLLFLQCINMQLVDHNDSAVKGNMFVDLAKTLLASAMPAVVTDLPGGTKGSRSKFQIICLYLLPQVAQFILHCCTASPVILDCHLPQHRKINSHSSFHFSPYTKC